MPLVVRTALVAAAVAAALLLVGWQRDEDRCTDTTKALFFELRDKAPASRIDERIAQTLGDCHGGEVLVGTAAVLFEVDESEHAETVLREAVARDPESFSAWAGLAAVTRKSDPAESQRAAERARELNPRYRPPS